MSEINNGGPAFPVLERGGNGLELTCAGMTLRDRFAISALQGLLPAGDPMGRSAYTEMKPDELAESAYEIADAMLRAREQP